MDSDTMTLYVQDGLQDIIMVEVSRSATLTDVKKKLLEKRARSGRDPKYIANGKVVREDKPLVDQGILSRHILHAMKPSAN